MNFNNIKASIITKLNNSSMKRRSKIDLCPFLTNLKRFIYVLRIFVYNFVWNHNLFLDSIKQPTHCAAKFA